MVDNLIDNTFALENGKAIVLIKDFFKKELPSFEMINLFDKGSYYGFRVEYKSKNIDLIFSGSNRGLEYEIFIDKKQYSLLNYDEKMKDVYACSEKNLKYTFSVLKRFLGNYISL